jgi:AcrR family transcriptional regulator
MADPILATRAKASRQADAFALCWTPRWFFKAKGGGVSVAEIAAPPGSSPSQVTYYFRTKGLFVEAACRECYVARQAELAAAGAVRLGYNRRPVETVGRRAALVEALSLTRRRQDPPR